MIFSSSQAVYAKHFTLPSCNLLFTALKRILLFHPDPIEFFHVEIHYFWNLSPNCTFLFSTLLLFLMLPDPCSYFLSESKNHPSTLSLLKKSNFFRTASGNMSIILTINYIRYCNGFIQYIFQCIHKRWHFKCIIFR